MDAWLRHVSGYTSHGILHRGLEVNECGTMWYPHGAHGDRGVHGVEGVEGVQGFSALKCLETQFGVQSKMTENGQTRWISDFWACLGAELPPHQAPTVAHISLKGPCTGLSYLI